MARPRPFQDIARNAGRASRLIENNQPRRNGCSQDSEKPSAREVPFPRRDRPDLHTTLTHRPCRWRFQNLSTGHANDPTGKDSPVKHSPSTWKPPIAEDHERLDRVQPEWGGSFRNRRRGVPRPPRYRHDRRFPSSDSRLPSQATEPFSRKHDYRGVSVLM